MAESRNPHSMTKLVQCLGQWRDLLVSFDGRNKQLFYRPLKTGDVSFTDKNLDQTAFQNLLAKNPTRVSQLYPKLFEGARKKSDVADSSIEDGELLETVVDEKDTGKLWNAKLRRFEAVYRKARENYDEKNIETCFLAEGFATWENLKPGATPNAPLILHSIKIEPNSRGNTDFNLNINGEAFFNQALILFFQREFGVDSARFDFGEENISLQSQPFKSLLQELKSKVKGFSLSEEFLLGNFSFQKYPMVMDMNRIMESGNFHQLLAAISGDNQSIHDINEIGSEDSLWELSNLNPIAENLIFPADSTQHQAISAVLGGKSVVIQGPPGSGKSQTIANLIAEAVAKNKRILFVAEKRAAIDAVVDRLDRKGLSGVVLDLHGDPDKKTIAKDLLAVVKAHSFPPQLSNANLKTLVAAKKGLNDRWDWLSSDSAIEGPNSQNFSNLQLLIELGELRSMVVPEHINLIESNLWRLDRLSAIERDEICQSLLRLEQLGYFEKSFHQFNLLERLPGIITPADFESFQKSLMAFSEFSNSPYWKQMVDHLSTIFNQELSTSESVKNAVGPLRTYIENQNIFDMGHFEEILAHKNSLLPSSQYRSAESVGLISGYFKKKKSREILLSFVKLGRQADDSSILARIDSLSEFLKLANRNEDSRDSLIRVLDELDTIENYVGEIASAYKIVKRHLRHSDLELSSNLYEFRKQIDQYYGLLAEVAKLPEIQGLLSSLEKYSLAPVFQVLISNNFEDGELEHFWNYAWLTSCLESSTKKISNFSLDSAKLDSQINSFADLDGKHLEGNVGKILTNLSSRVHSLPDADRQLLVRESMKKAGHLPFRRLLQQIPQSILALKPVMAMSPLAVSQLLPCIPELFDLVIFDEASQIRPHDAITSIYRAKQLVVAGDRFQLPPTEFGERAIEDELSGSDEESVFEEAATTGMESILTTAVAVFNHNVKPLGLHYRSNDERLISWSNFNIYRKAGEELFTFPSRAIDADKTLRYTYLPDVKISSMQMPNEAEVQAVKEAVLNHVRSTPELTLGVIAFGIRHAVRLQDTFNILERESDLFYQWKSSWTVKQDQFFIKNIERVQGDERDAIIITPGYAPNLDGSVPLQFGTLNRQGGERRLNVAASRAKEYVHLITSMKSSQIEMSRTKSASIGLLRSYLEFMENGGKLIEPIVGFETATTPFEAEILEALRNRGLEVDCQVGDSGFKIDFAIRDSKTNAYVLAIEADGATYHSSAYARERDYMRQRILEDRGWRFVRIWSTDWWRDPESQVNRVLTALDRQPERQTEEHPLSQSEVKPSRFDDDQEFLIFRGILAKNRHATESEILGAWMDVLGKQRVTDKLYAKFKEFWVEAKRTI